MPCQLQISLIVIVVSINCLPVLILVDGEYKAGRMSIRWLFAGSNKKQSCQRLILSLGKISSEEDCNHNDRAVVVNN